MENLDRFEKTKFYADGYRISTVLGRGTFGTVYLVEKKDEFVYRQMAVKHIHHEQRLTNLTLSRYRGNRNGALDSIMENAKKLGSEISILAAIRGHENIACYTDHQFEIAQLPEGASVNFWILKEYYQDVLSDLIKNRNLTILNALRIMDDVACAFEFLHNQNIVHRDLKPENILVDTIMNKAKVDDFGQSKFSGGNMTQTMGIGTPLYSAPEVDANQHHYDSRLADIFSMGAVFFESISMKSPFCEGLTPNMTEDQVLSCIITNKTRSHIGSFDFLNSIFEDIVKKSTAPLAHERYQDISAMRNDIKELLKPETYNTKGLELFFKFRETKDIRLFDKAEKNLKMSLQINKNYKAALNSLGNIFRESDKKKAEKYYREALSIDPDYEIARDNLNNL